MRKIMRDILRIKWTLILCLWLIAWAWWAISHSGQQVSFTVDLLSCLRLVSTLWLTGLFALWAYRESSADDK